MKTIFSLVFIGVIFSYPGQAQEVDFGGKIGLNLANIGGDIEDVETRIGYHLGGYALFALTKQISVQPEILYSSQGAQSSRISEVKIKFSYLNIPLLAKINISKALNALVGPQVGFLLDAKLKDSQEAEDASDAYKSADLGVVLGLQYDLPNGVNLGARYNLGLSNIDAVFDDASFYTENNQVIQLTVGYTFTNNGSVRYRNDY